MKSQRVWKGDVGDRLSVSIEVNKQKLGDHVGPEVSVPRKKYVILIFTHLLLLGIFSRRKKIQRNTKRYR